MNIQTTIILVLIFVLLIGIGFGTRSVKKRRHAKNVKKSIALRNTFIGWQGSHIDGRILSYLKNINAYVFEELILTSIECIGGSIKRNHSYSGDGGSDGEFRYNGKRYAIQAKCYKKHINIEHVKKFNRLCEQRFNGGLLVHTGRTGNGIWKIRSDKVKIISGSRLVDLVLGRKKLETFL